MNENTTSPSKDGKKASDTAPQFIFLELKKDVNLSDNDIAEFCKTKGIKLEQSVFIFPGNNEHHEDNNSLHKLRKGSGLAALAGSLWHKSMPTLSLPTVMYKKKPYINQYDYSTQHPVAANSTLVNDAVTDIWRAIGYGLNIVLPVRAHSNQTFFRNSIKGTTFEPAFWGAINPIPNLAVADRYLIHLANIRSFLSAEPGKKAELLEWLKTNIKPAYDAYQEGLTNKTSSSPSAWFTAGKKPQIAKTETTVLNKSAQAMTDDAPIKDKSPLSSVPVTKTVSSASAHTTTERTVERFKKLAPLSEVIRGIISASDALKSNVSQYERLIGALDKLQQVEQEHSKSVLKQATKIGFQQAVERSKYWTIAQDIFTSIHPNGGYVFDLNFKKGKLVSLDTMNFRKKGKQDRHVTPISVIKHLFEEQLQEDMTPDEARNAILSHLETFRSGIETNLRTRKAYKRIVDYLEKLDADKKPKSSEALFDLMDLYIPEELKIINSILSDAFKAPMVLEVVKEEIIHKLEEFEDDIPAHIIINYFKTNDFTKDPDPIKNLETAIRPYFSNENLKELTKLFTEVLKKPFDLKVAKEKILTALEEDEFGKYDNKKMKVARYVQAIFDYYSHPGTVEDEDHLKELLKVVAHFYNEKAQLVISDGYIPIPDKTPDRYLIPTLDFGGKKFFYDRNKDKKSAKKDSDSDNEDDTKKEKKDAEGTFINMQNKILTGLNWILLMGTDDSDSYKLENNLAFKTLKFSQKTISHINKRSAQIKDAIKIAENIVDLSDNKKMLTEQELNQAIYAIYAMFDYMPLPDGANNPDGKKFDANRHRYVGEPKSRLFEVAANHLQFVFAAYPQLKEHYGDEIRDGFLHYVAYGVTEKNLIGLGIAKELKKKKIKIKQFTNDNKGRVYGFGNQYTDNSPVSVKNFYDEMQEKVEEILITRDSSFHNDMDSNPLNPPSSPDFDSQIFQDTHVIAVILYLHYSYDKSLNEDFSNLPEPLKKILHLEGKEFNALFQRKLSNITNLKPMDTSVENEERDDEDYLPENLQIFNAIKQAYSEWPQKPQFSDSELVTLDRALKDAMHLKDKSNGHDSNQSNDSEDDDDDEYDDEDDDEIIKQREIWQEFLQGLYLLNDDEEKLTNTAPTLNISGPRRIVANHDNHGVFNAMVLGIADLVLTDKLSNNEQRQAFYAFLQKELILDVSTLTPDAAFKLWLKDKPESEIQQKLSPLLRKFVASKIFEKYPKNYQYYYTNELQAAFNSFAQGKLHENLTFGSHLFIQVAFDKINKDGNVTNKMQAVNNWWLKEGAKQYFTNIQSKEHPLSLKLWKSDVEIAALGMELGVNFNLKGISNDTKGGLIPFDWSNPKHVWLAYWLRDRNMGDFYFGHFQLNQFAGITDLKQLLGPASAKAVELLKGFLSKNQLEQPIVCTDENTALISELVQRGILRNKDNSNNFYLTIRSLPHIEARLEGLPSTLIKGVTAEELSRLNREFPIFKNPNNANYFDELLQRGIFGYRNDKNDGNIYLIAPANQLAARLQGFTAEDRKLIEDSYRSAIQQSIVIEKSAEYCTYVRPMAIRKQLEPNIVDEPIIQKKTSGKTWQNITSKKDSKDQPEEVPTVADGNCAFNAMALGIADLVRTDLLLSNEQNKQRQPFYAFLQTELNLDVSTSSNVAAFKLWLKDKSNFTIQKTLAPLLRKYAIVKIDEQYPANYQENYEGLLKFAFDLYLQGKSREDDTFAVHAFITTQFKALKQKHGKLDDNKAEDKEKVKNRENELIDWWRKTGKVEYFKVLSQPALSAGDTERWGSDVEPAALAFNLGIGYHWRKFGAEQSLSIGSGLIPVSENLLHLQQLRNRGVGDFYSGAFRLEEYPDLEHLKQLLGPAKQETVDSLNEFLRGDPKRPFALSKSNPIVENELIQRKILTRKRIAGKPVWFLADLTEGERNARLIALPELTAKLATDHYQPNIPKLTIENSGGHWTYLRAPEISKKLAPVSAPPNVDIPKSAPTKLPEAENIPPVISKQNLVTEGLIAAIKAKVDCAYLNIVYLDNNYQLSLKPGVEGKADRRKLINFLEDNDITNYNATPSHIAVDNKQMDLIKKLLPPELLNSQPKKELTPPDKGASTEVPALKHAQTVSAVNMPGNSTHPKWGRIATEHRKQHTEAQDQTKGKAKGTIQFGAKRKILDADPNMEKGVHSAKKENEKGSVNINAANTIPNDQSTKKESENRSVDINAANTTPSDVKRRKANETPDSDNALVDDSNKASPPSTTSTFVRRGR